MWNEDTQGEAINHVETYYVRVRGRIQGPFTIEQLKAMRQRGQFSRAYEVSSDQITWITAGKLDSIFASARPSAQTITDCSAEAPEDAVEVMPTIPIPATPTKPTWYYTVGEEQYGPVSLLELRRLVASGEVIETDLVWKEGMPDWRAVRDAKEIKGTTSSEPKMGRNRQAGINQAFCYACGTAIDTRAELCPECGVRQLNKNDPEKSRVTVAILALFVGGLGIHRFYLGGTSNVVLGIIYLIFCWTFIPAIVALIEGIYFLCISDATFQTRYKR